MRTVSNHPKPNYLKAALIAFLALGGLALTTACLYPEHGRREDEHRRVEPEHRPHDHDGHEDHEGHDFHPG